MNIGDCKKPDAIMKYNILVVVFLVLTLLLGCSPKAPVTVPPTQEAPVASETPVPTPVMPTAPITPSPSTTASQPTLPSPSIPPSTTTPPTPTRPLPPLDAFMKGFFFADWAPLTQPPAGAPPFSGLYAPPETDMSLKNLAATGTNWIGLNVVCEQATIASTTIVRAPPRTASDAELLRIINLAHSLGMRVMLRPQVSLADYPAHWSGDIGSAFTSEAQWQEWFTSYREFINHYASFSQEAGADMLCLGVEMGGVTHREQDWRRIIQEVRERYKGPLTYSSLASIGGNYLDGEGKRIKWWDAVDYIGTTGYYPLTDKNDPTVAELKAAWTGRGYIALLENLSKKFNKPIIFTEIGYESKDGTNRMPASGQTAGTLDFQEQADCYQATLEVMLDKSWFRGIFWFQWLANTRFPGSSPTGTGFMPWGKPAEEVLKRFYLSQ